MAQQVDLQATQSFIALAVMHLANNDPSSKLPVYGGIMALKSPNFAQIRDSINPLTITDNTRVAWNTSGSRPFPTVKTTYKPLNARAVQSTRTNRTAGTGVKPTDGASFTTNFDIYYEPVDATQKNISTDVKAMNVDQYLERWLDGKLSIANVVFDNNKNLTPFGRFASDIWTRSAKDILPALDTNLLTRTFANVGTNPAFPAVVTPTAGAPIVELNGFLTINGTSVPDPALWKGLVKTRDNAKMQGKPILLGGSKWLDYHILADIVTVNTSIGIDFQKVYSNSNYDFYYDEACDTIFGQDVAVLIEANTLGFQEFVYNGTPHIPANTLHANNYFTSFNANFFQFSPQSGGFNNTHPSVSLMMDLRMKESVSAQDFPVTEFVPSVGAGLWTRPVGYLTTDSGDKMRTYTGVCAFKIL